MSMRVPSQLARSKQTPGALVPASLCTRTLALALHLCAWAAPPVAVEPLALKGAAEWHGLFLQKQRNFCMFLSHYRGIVLQSRFFWIACSRLVACSMSVSMPPSRLLRRYTSMLPSARRGDWLESRWSSPWIQQKRLVLTAGSGDDNRRLLPEKQGGEALAPRVQ